MARILILIVAVGAVSAVNPWRRQAQEYEAPDVLSGFCNETQEMQRMEMIEKAKCGPPKDVFVELKVPSASIQLSPGSVWVKRCVGICDYQVPDTQCYAIDKRIDHIPIRVFNLDTYTERCLLYSIEVHDTCGCCSGWKHDCVAPRVFNHRKCACHCPNRKEREECFRKDNTKWSRSKCICEMNKEENKE